MASADDIRKTIDTLLKPKADFTPKMNITKKDRCIVADKLKEMLNNIPDKDKSKVSNKYRASVEMAMDCMKAGKNNEANKARLAKVQQQVVEFVDLYSGITNNNPTGRVASDPKRVVHPIYNYGNKAQAKYIEKLIAIGKKVSLDEVDKIRNLLYMVVPKLKKGKSEAEDKIINNDIVVKFGYTEKMSKRVKKLTTVYEADIFYVTGKKIKGRTEEGDFHTMLRKKYPELVIRGVMRRDNEKKEIYRFSPILLKEFKEYLREDNAIDDEIDILNDTELEKNEIDKLNDAELEKSERDIPMQQDLLIIQEQNRHIEVLNNNAKEIRLAKIKRDVELKNAETKRLREKCKLLLLKGRSTAKEQSKAKKRLKAKKRSKATKRSKAKKLSKTKKQLKAKKRPVRVDESDSSVSSESNNSNDNVLGNSSKPTKSSDSSDSSETSDSSESSNSSETSDSNGSSDSSDSSDSCDSSDSSETSNYSESSNPSDSSDSESSEEVTNHKTKSKKKPTKPTKK